MMQHARYFGSHVPTSVAAQSFTMRNATVMGFLRLPFELVEEVAAWLWSDVLSMVCRWLRRLGRRYVKMKCETHRAMAVLQSAAPTLRVLIIYVDPGVGPSAFACQSVATILQQIGPHARHLHTLILPRELRGSVMNAAPHLQNMVRLSDLRIDVSHRAQEPRLVGAERFSALKALPHLRNLYLNLSGNKLGDTGAKALAELREAPLLHKLRLDCSKTKVGDVGAKALAELCEAPLLHKLHLDCSKTQVGDVGAKAFATLGRACKLKVLTLSLDHTWVGPSGAGALGLLKDCPRLRSLKLNLSYTTVKDTGAAGLAALAAAPRLRSLELNLEGSDRGPKISDKGAQALAGLHKARCLRSLDLNLRFNKVKDEGAKCLALLGAPQLHSLRLDLAGNMIASSGASALVDRSTVLMPRIFVLHLERNKISHSTQVSLEALHVEGLKLDVSQQR